MCRLLPVVLLLVGLPLAVSAPVPKDFETPEEKIGRLFGRPVRPEESKVELARRVLRVTAPTRRGQGGPLSLDPRTERTVAGNFEMTVRVTTDWPGDARVWCRAGLYVRLGDDDHFAFARHLDNSPGARRLEGERGFGWQRWRNGDSTSDWSPEKEAAPSSVLLRIIRDGRRLTAAAKYDQNDWWWPAKADVDAPDSVTVGVFVNASRGPYTAEFEDFNVTPLK